ncbi:MAG: hypothetical protein KAS67_00695, partial [Thermoplasmata archaeon]|nr:hypothetical protein [Thermoplasmata archaeon]
MQEWEERISGLGRFFAILIIMAMLLPASYGFSTTSGIQEASYGDNEASDSTLIRISHAGLEFDNQVGEPALANNMKAANSDKYIVQFKGPIMPAWKQELKDLGAKVHQYVEDNAYVVEMDEAAKSDIDKLANVQWVGEYHPAYKVDWTLNDKKGETELAVFAFDNALALANKLKNIGTVVDTEEEFGKVYLRTDASNIPTVAQLSDVNYIFFQPEYQTLNNVAGEIDDCHTLWEVEKSGFPMIITGLGIRIGIQDTGWDNGDETNGHWDFTKGPLGARVAIAEADGDQHGTHCAGVMAGNGYCMEEWLGLDNMNQVYYEEAASNPSYYGNDLEGFAGVAPEATLEAHQPLGTGDWATMSANGCVVISNSWGPTGVPAANYDADCQSADTLMNGNPIIIMPFACGSS